jgi:hypothetical protein
MFPASDVFIVASQVIAIMLTIYVVFMNVLISTVCANIRR